MRLLASLISTLTLQIAVGWVSRKQTLRWGLVWKSFTASGLGITTHGRKKKDTLWNRS